MVYDSFRWLKMVKKLGKRKTEKQERREGREENSLSHPLTCYHQPQSLPQPASMSLGPSRLPPPPGGRILAGGCPPEHLPPGESLEPGPESITEISVINSGKFSRKKILRLKVSGRKWDMN